MPLSQTARSHHLDRQKKSLTLCLGAAIAAHGLMFMGGSLERRDSRQERNPIGVEFVYLDPAVSASGSPESDRRAQVDSVAGGTRKEETPVGAGTASQPAAALPLSDAGSLPLQENRSAPPGSAQSPPPVPANPAQTPAASPPSSRLAESQPVAQRTDPSRPTRTSEGTPARSSAVSPPATPPRPARSASATPASQPATLQTGQGLNEPLNPDRTANGTGRIDAVADDRWGTYMAILNRQVDQHWQRIGISARRQAQVRFEIDRSGQLIAATLVQSSGDAAADNAALQAVHLAAPFSPFPDRTTEPSLNVTFTFHYYPAQQSPQTDSPAN